MISSSVFQHGGPNAVKSRARAVGLTGRCGLPSPLNGDRFPRKISRIEPLNAQRSANFQIGAIRPAFSNAPIWKSALEFMARD
jgi:hypothetical protein